MVKNGSRYLVKIRRRKKAFKYVQGWGKVISRQAHTQGGGEHYEIL